MSSRRVAGAALATLLLAGCQPHRQAEPVARVAQGSWHDVTLGARDSVVTFRMWRGDPGINHYIDDWVAPRLAERFGITLRAIEGDGAALVNDLALEREAGAEGTTDLIWINGQTFAQLRTRNLLGGPWAGRLPNAQYIDSASPIIARDFEQDPAGFESPWGRVQFALIYDTLRTPSPPRTVDELGAWIVAHPGRFTHDQGFTGMTFLKGVMYALSGGVASFEGGFDESRYARASGRLFTWLDRHRAAFWRGGRTYPPGVADLHRLFANGEVDFTMSANQNEVIAKIHQGVLPVTARPLLLRDGTIANTHYLGIPFNAPHPAAALVVANFLLSPEAQLQKLRPDVWADGTVLDIRRLPPEWAARFAELAVDPRALPADSLARYARPEVSPAWHERLQAEWRQRVRQQ